jgi:riboflavin kinase/FMN adenylyltransferase
MKAVLHSVQELAVLPGPVVLAIGVFDGVHLGHQAVICRALQDAQYLGGTTAVVTFDPHPARVLRPDQAPRLLTTTEQKLELIRGMGVNTVLVLPFTREFSEQSPERFIRDLAVGCRPLREVCVGHQWSFGKGRGGNLALLNLLGKELGFEEVGVAAVEEDGRIVSSTLIRGYVEAGCLETATRLLGRPYSIQATVVRGQGLGSTLGFPTANLAVLNDELLPGGVYAVRCQKNGQNLLGVLNYGTRPTVAGSGVAPRVMEVHLLGYEGELYGESLSVQFHSRIRAEQKFSSVEELKAQIAKDCAEAIRRISGH